MTDKFTDMLTRKLTVDWSKCEGPLDLRYHSIGIGGINPMPPTPDIIETIKKLKPPMVRIFLQEFFFIYKGNGVYDWSILDPYMEAVHAIGGDIMASICIKPNSLYPVIDETIWMPTNVEEWQDVMRALVKRYSIEKPYVTHWTIANEQNIGELGACPYLITNPDDYYQYYKFTAAPIRQVLPPEIKVGGPSYAGGGESAGTYLARFVELCKRDNVQVDFVCYNAYTDNPVHHALDGRAVRDALDKVDPGVKLYMTEMNVGIDDGLSLEEKPYQPACAASMAAAVLALHKNGCLDGSFQYHMYDQYAHPQHFESWYARVRYITRYWNDTINRVGLVDLDGKRRPQYYVYEMLYALEGQQVSISGTNEALHGIASKSTDGSLNILLANYAGKGTPDAVTQFQFSGADAGIYRLEITRIDKETCGKMKNEPGYILTPTESRDTYVHPDFHFDVSTPADSVTLIRLLNNKEEQQ